MGTCNMYQLRLSFSATMAVLFSGSILPNALAQFSSRSSSADCDKYCFASCSKYFDNGGGEFSACVTANVECGCAMKLNSGNPFAWFIFMFFIMLLIALCVFCNRSYRTRFHNSGSHPIVAQPIVSTITGNHNTRSTNYAAPLPPGFGISAVPVLPSKPMAGDIPPEYFPPPAYNECVVNVR